MMHCINSTLQQRSEIAIDGLIFFNYGDFCQFHSVGVLSSVCEKKLLRPFFVSSCYYSDDLIFNRGKWNSWPSNASVIVVIKLI
jgi:hypothetical protein